MSAQLPQLQRWNVARVSAQRRHPSLLSSARVAALDSYSLLVALVLLVFASLLGAVLTPTTRWRRSRTTRAAPR
jgi:hypothetical protein